MKTKQLNPDSEMGWGGTGNLPVPVDHRPNETERRLTGEIAARKSSGALPVPSGGSPLGTAPNPFGAVPPSEARSSGLAWHQSPRGNWRKSYFGFRISDFFRISGIRISSFGAKGSLALALVLASPVAFAQSNGIPGPQDYPLFSHFITDRNIFDPNRLPHSYNAKSTFHPTTRRQKGTPGIQLVGTMSYEKGLFAFFSGNNSELSKVLQVGSKIVDYTIMEIAPSFVVLESADKKQQPKLEVGDGLRQENGKWVLAKAGDLPAASGAPDATEASGSNSASDTSAAPAAAGEPNDVLKRLMEKRQKENQ